MICFTRFSTDSIGGVEYVVKSISEACPSRLIICLNHKRSFLPKLIKTDGYYVYKGENWGRLGKIDLNITIFILAFFFGLFRFRLFIHLPFIQSLPILFSPFKLKIMIHALSSEGLLGGIHKRIIIFLSRRHDVCVTSNTMKNNLEEISNFRNISVIPLCLTQQDERLSSIIWNNRNTKISNNYVFFGRNAPYKGINYLIQAWKSRPDKILDYQLHCFGPGTQSLTCNSENIFGFGKVSKELAYAKLSESRILILPSINDGEAFGIVQIEAMLLGLPIIVTDINSGTHEVAGKYAFIIKPKSIIDLHESFINTYNLEIPRAEIREYALSKYSRKVVISKYINFLNER